MCYYTSTDEINGVENWPQEGVVKVFRRWHQENEKNILVQPLPTPDIMETWLIFLTRAFIVWPSSLKTWFAKSRRNFLVQIQDSSKLALIQPITLLVLSPQKLTSLLSVSSLPGSAKTGSWPYAALIFSDIFIIASGSLPSYFPKWRFCSILPFSFLLHIKTQPLQDSVLIPTPSRPHTKHSC